MHEPENIYSCAVITISDKGAAGKREDTSGVSLKEILQKEGFNVVYYEIIADDKEAIAATLIRLSDELKISLIVTTGGTGVSPSDVTPEATRQIIEKEIPGMAEAMRAESLKKTVHAMISRGVVGIRGKSLIVNLPGSKRASQENIEVILSALPHAIDKILGSQVDCGTVVP